MSASDEEIIRVQELWFNDGNLVVQAENHLYRVTKGILAARSPIFSDMLSFPQPPDSDLVDGCPAVRLPDSAGDVTVFLKAIFDSSFFEPPPSSAELSGILGVLRLSHKYDVQYLRRRALLHLETAYPVTLEAYDARETASTFTRTSTGHILVAEVAQQVEAQWIVPCALYRASCYGLKAILGPGQTLSSLRRACIMAFPQHALAYTSRPPFLLLLPLQGLCESEERCKLIYRVFMKAWETSDRVVHRGPDVLREWAHRIGILKKISITPPCRPCREHLIVRLTQQREQWWNAMPSLYSLPDWGELTSIRDSSL
ncbi:hypothetical protein B0H10DRAFT_1873027 [Mycena sp. CBHHK59/15]|nr:hypothetical protein B0H10DRAFT_1873027 [Mycena sp. CBHHK59/15]